MAEEFILMSGYIPSKAPRLQGERSYLAGHLLAGYWHAPSMMPM
jgi:hypothetical protein